MAEYIVTDTDLTLIADKIRQKGGTSSPLVWPSEYVSAIDAISTGETFAFIKARYTVGDTVTATNGDITLTSDTSGYHVFEIPYSNNNTWTVTSTNYGNSFTFTLVFGDSKNAPLDLFTLIQTDISPAPAIEFDFSGGNLVVTVIASQSQSGITHGIVFSSSIYTKIQGSGQSGQYGICTSSASLPSIVSSGTGRGSFSQPNGTDVIGPTTSTYPYFFISLYNSDRVSFTLLN